MKHSLFSSSYSFPSSIPSIHSVICPPNADFLPHISFIFTDQRRNNVEFRRNLLKEKRKSEKAHQAQASKARASQSDALKNAVREMRNDRAPQSVEEREAYFLEQVAMGEALAAQGGCRLRVFGATLVNECTNYPSNILSRLPSVVAMHLSKLVLFRYAPDQTRNRPYERLQAKLSMYKLQLLSSRDCKYILNHR